MAWIDDRKDWYGEYLRSDHWREIRTRKLEQAGYECERCGFRGKRELGHPAIGLAVHHRTYERLHNESLDDLEVLCGWCHEQEHGRHDHATREQWQARLVDRALRLRGLAVDDIDLEVAAWDELAEKVEAV